VYSFNLHDPINILVSNLCPGEKCHVAPRTERLVSSSHAASELGIAASRDGKTLAIVFEELGDLV